jgi:hypothetical protein
MSVRRRRVLQGMLGAGALTFAGRAATQSSAADGPRQLQALPRHALVIGNSQYKEAPLRNPANDANALAARLKGLGFHVTQALDASRSAMLEAIDAYNNSLARQGAVGLFYFAGHGVQLAWRNYLIPVDAVVDNPEDVRERAVELNTLLQGLTRAKNPMNVIILDACRDNPFGTRVRPEQRGLSQFDAPPGSLLAYATAPGNVASDGDGEHGLYTENLLREIQVPEAKIEDVFKRVRLHVRRRTKGQQIPWESTSLEDDFYFLPPKSAARLEESTQYGQWRNFMLRVGQLGQAAPDYRTGMQLAQASARRDSQRVFEEQLAVWERLQHTQEPEMLSDFLLRYPSGYFSELAEFRLDQVLARQGEKKIQVVSSPDNPFSKGTAVADTRRKVGDSYTYRVTDLFTGLEIEKFTETITQVTDTTVVYDSGHITDLLGNPLRYRDGVVSTGNQFWGVDYSVGRRWTSRSKTKRPGNPELQIEVEVRVVSRETIVLPAGKFNAFVVEANGWAIGPGINTRLLSRRWIAPDQVRNSLVYESTRTAASGKVLRSQREELVSYRQS